MARNTRNYPKTDNETLQETVSKLKARLRKLTKENKQLKIDNESLLEAWAKTESFLSEITKDVSLEELLEHKTLPKKVTRKKVAVDDTDDQEKARLKWKKWREENL